MICYNNYLLIHIIININYSTNKVSLIIDDKKIINNFFNIYERNCYVIYLSDEYNIKLNSLILVLELETMSRVVPINITINNSKQNDSSILNEQLDTVYNKYPILFDNNKHDFLTLLYPTIINS
jgi:hypothetical protein